MPDFHYRMAGADGRLQSGVMAAPDEAGLADRIRHLGGVLIAAKPVRVRAPKVRLTRRERMTFTGHLETAVGAGIPVIEAIRGFGTYVPDKGLAHMLEDVAHGLEGGESLAHALGRYPKAFSPLYVSMVATGEETGRLDTVLGRLNAYLEWQDALARDLRQATVYPVVIITLVLALIVFLLTFVLPRLVGIFGKAAAIPEAARVLLGVSAAFAAGWPYMVAGLVLGSVAFAFARRRDAVALWLDRAALRVPLFGTTVRLIRVSQLMYCLGLLLDAGVDIARSLTLAEGVVENRHLALKVADVGERVVGGGRLSEALQETAIFPPLALQMVAVGEEGGRLPDALFRATEFLRREVQASIRFALSILEPAIIIVLGVVVGGIALTVFYTLYTIISSIGGAR
jgi:type II secretory pathway component PulF